MVHWVTAHPRICTTVPSLRSDPFQAVALSERELGPWLHELGGCLNRQKHKASSSVHRSRMVVRILNMKRAPTWTTLLDELDWACRLVIRHPRQLQRRLAIVSRKFRQVSPARYRGQDETEPGWSCPARQSGDTISPFLGIAPHQDDLRVRIHLHHFRHEVGRRKVYSTHESGCGPADQLKGCFGIAGVSSLVSLDPGATVV